MLNLNFFNNRNLKSSDFLSNLIGAGPDASLNLFKVTFSRDDMKILEARTKDFISPTRDAETESVPYQNIDIGIPVPSTSIPRTLTMGLRLDSGYASYNLLKKNQVVNSLGQFSKEGKEISSITISAYEPTDTEMMNEVYRWVFENAYILKVSPLSYSYESANQASCNITFVWGSYDEGLPMEMNLQHPSLNIWQPGSLNQ